MSEEKTIQVSQALQSIIDNPDDLSTLPQLVARVQEMEGTEEQYQERISRLQEINRSYLAQIPIPGNDPTPEPEDEQPTFEDAQQELLKAMQNVGGN